jgi:hypothetical protein
MAGLLLHHLVLEDLLPDLSQRQAVIGCDNSPAVAWMRRMATRASSLVAHRLLRGLTIRQRTTRAAPPEILHRAGKHNVLADVASRPNANVPVSNPPAFLAYSNARFVLPQSPSWIIVHPNFDLSSNAISTLRGLTDCGYDIKRIGTHSLRVSSAMALKLDGVDADTIMIVGRWTSPTFLLYIHSQIAVLNVGLAQRMARPIYFQNGGG